MIVVRICATLVLPWVLQLSVSRVGATDTISTWTGGIGNWSNAGNWSPTGAVPNNGPGVTYVASINSGEPTTNIAVNIADLRMNGGTLNLDQPLHTAEMTMRGGNVFGPGLLSIDGDLILRGGLINTTAEGPTGFVVGGKVIKRGFGKATFAPFSSADFEIVIEEGKFRGVNGGVGTSARPVTVAGPEFARLQLSTFGIIAADVHLNNAHGFNGTGALVSGVDRSLVTGDVYLGEIGSTIGVVYDEGVGEALTLRGRIHGGALRAAGDGWVVLEAAGHTYSGPTRIGDDGEGTELHLRNSGEIQSTSGIELGRDAQLVLDNVSQLNSDRVSDHAPIRTRGGTIEIRGSETLGGPHASELLGLLQLVQGASSVRLQHQVEHLSFEGMERHELATIDFVSSGIAAARKFFFNQAPTVIDGYLGGWATYQDDFATYDSTTGVVGLHNRVARPAQIEGALAGDHVRTSSTTAPLTGNRTINSLVLNGGDVSLEGNTLAISGGGLINGPGPRLIHGGQLTAGDGLAPAVLYFRCIGVANVDAAIADHGTAGPLTLVKTGSSNLNLSGVNTHSGVTVVQEGVLQFTTERSISSASELVLDGALARLQFQPTAPTKIPRLTLKQRAFIGAPTISGTDRSTITLDAAEIVLESGFTNISFSGNGLMRKITDGVAEVGFDSPEYHGSVIVERGTLVAGSHSVARSPRALGTGVTTVNPGGTLVHSAVAPGMGYMQLDATLHLSGGTVGLGGSFATPRWDFTREWQVSESSRMLLFDPLAQSEITLPTVNLQQVTTLDEGAELEVLGEGTVNFAAGISVAGNASLRADESSVVLAAISSAVDGGELHLRGASSFRIPGVLSTAPDKSLALEISPDTTATLATRTPFSIADRVTLAVNGRIVNGQPLVLNGGTLQGVGVLGAVTNKAGIVSPGNSVGELQVGVFNQEANGTLNIELLGGPSLVGDQLRAESANLSGTLSAVLVPEAEVAFGDVFDVLIANQIQTQDFRLETTGFSATHRVVMLTTGADAGRMSLQLMVVPEPCVLAITFPLAWMVWCPLRFRWSKNKKALAVPYSSG